MEQTKTLDMLGGEFAILDWLRHEIDANLQEDSTQSLANLQNEIESNLSLLGKFIIKLDFTDKEKRKRYKSAKERLQKIHNLIEEQQVSSLWEIREKMIEHMEEVHNEMTTLEQKQLH